MTDREVSSFVTKFSDLLHDGQKASLVMDCNNGEARVTLEVFLQPDRHQNHRRAEHQEHCHPPHYPRHPPQHARHPYQPPSGRAGPSRIRRRARRQAAAQVSLCKPPDHHPPPPPDRRDDRRAGHHPRPADRHGGYHPPPADRRAGHQPPPAERRTCHPPPPPAERRVGPYPPPPAPPHPVAEVAHHAGHHPPPADGRAGYHPPPADRRKCHPPPPPAERRAGRPYSPPAERVGPYPPPPPAPPQPVAEVAHHPNPTPEESPTPSPSSYSSVASPKFLARPPDLPGSPGGWGAVDPTRAEGEDNGYDDSEEDCAEQRERADLGSFCFSPLEPPEHPPSPSPHRRPFKRLQKKCLLIERRKPVNHLKSLLYQNIERAAQLRNSSEGCGRWVWKVCVLKDFETKMIYDHTSFIGFTHKEVQSILQTQAELDEENEEYEEYEEEKEK